MAAPLIALATRLDPGGLGHSAYRGLLEAGFRVELVEYRDPAPRIHRASLRGSGAANNLLVAALRPLAELRLVHALQRIRPQLVVFLKLCELHRATYRAIRGATGARLVAFHPDDPFNHATLLRPGPAHRRAIVQLREVDVNLTWSRALVGRIREAGARSVGYLPFAADPATHPPGRPTDAERGALGADLTFVGNWDEERERWLAPVAHRCAAEGLRLAVWGTDYWRVRCRDAAVRAAWRGRPLSGAEFSAATVSSAVNINVLRLQNKDAVNMRSFEIPAAGGFMLHERSADLAEHFPPGVACDDFATPDELFDKARAYLSDTKRREAVAAEGHRRALAWTYREWAQRLVELASDGAAPR